MFTGIIEEVADILDDALDGEITTLRIQKPASWKLKLGQSIAIDGVCLTVVDFDENQFSVELMPETIDRSTFGEPMPSRVNLEKAMSVEGLLEGHIVQGHVDAKSEIVGIEESPKWRTLKIAYPKNKGVLLVDKGSIALSGISLTIVEVQEDWFSVSLIPHTLEHTSIASKKVGDFVNVEYDVIAKLIAKQADRYSK